MQDNSIRQAVTGALSRLGGAQPVVPVVPNTNGFIGLPQQPSQQPSQPQVIEQHNCNPTGLQRMNKPVRTQGNRTPAVVDGKLRSFTVAAAGDAFAGFIAATTGGAAFNDEPNRYYLKRNGGKQSYIDKRYMYALGVELTVVAQPTAGNVDLAQASALQGGTPSRRSRPGRPTATAPPTRRSSSTCPPTRCCSTTTAAAAACRCCLRRIRSSRSSRTTTTSSSTTTASGASTTRPPP
jgi:hypothetical protein